MGGDLRTATDVADYRSVLSPPPKSLEKQIHSVLIQELTRH